MPKKVLIALPPAMLEQVDYIAHYEHRTRSDLIREALRRYLDAFKKEQVSRIVPRSSALLPDVEVRVVPQQQQMPRPIIGAAPAGSCTQTESTTEGA